MTLWNMHYHKEHFHFLFFGQFQSYFTIRFQKLSNIFWFLKNIKVLFMAFSVTIIVLHLCFLMVSLTFFLWLWNNYDMALLSGQLSHQTTVLYVFKCWQTPEASKREFCRCLWEHLSKMRKYKIFWRSHNLLRSLPFH